MGANGAMKRSLGVSKIASNNMEPAMKRKLSGFDQRILVGSWFDCWPTWPMANLYTGAG